MNPYRKISNDQVISSIGVGISFYHINNVINPAVGLIGIITNTPALVGAEATAIAHNELIRDYQITLVKGLFSAVGMVVELDGRDFEAVTG